MSADFTIEFSSLYPTFEKRQQHDQLTDEIITALFNEDFNSSGKRDLELLYRIYMRMVNQEYIEDYNGITFIGPSPNLIEFKGQGHVAGYHGDPVEGTPQGIIIKYKNLLWNIYYIFRMDGMNYLKLKCGEYRVHYIYVPPVSDEV